VNGMTVTCDNNCSEAFDERMDRAGVATGVGVSAAGMAPVFGVVFA